jgi:hypothetical protein
MSLRTRIETNWPQAGGFLRRQSSTAEAREWIDRLISAMPSPLPLTPGGRPEEICRETDTDLRVGAGRAVDAAMALLEGNSLDAVYPGRVSMMAGMGSSATAGSKSEAEPIEIDEPSVGLLVATIIGTLEAISERLIPSTGGRDVRR